MKTTMKLMLMLLVVAASILTFTSCKKWFDVPEKVTVYGQVTYEDGQPAEGVGISVSKSTFMSMIYPVTSTKTDGNGHYELEIDNPQKKVVYAIDFEITKDGCHYSYSDFVDEYKARQEINAVLTKEGK